MSHTDPILIIRSIADLRKSKRSILRNHDRTIARLEEELDRANEWRNTDAQSCDLEIRILHDSLTGTPGFMEGVIKIAKDAGRIPKAVSENRAAHPDIVRTTDDGIDLGWEVIFTEWAHVTMEEILAYMGPGNIQ